MWQQEESHEQNKKLRFTPNLGFQIKAIQAAVRLLEGTQRQETCYCLQAVDNDVLDLARVYFPTVKRGMRAQELTCSRFPFGAMFFYTKVRLRSSAMNISHTSTLHASG